MPTRPQGPSIDRTKSDDRTGELVHVERDPSHMTFRNFRDVTKENEAGNKAGRPEFGGSDHLP